LYEEEIIVDPGEFQANKRQVCCSNEDENECSNEELFQINNAKDTNASYDVNTEDNLSGQHDENFVNLDPCEYVFEIVSNKITIINSY